VLVLQCYMFHIACSTSHVEVVLRKVAFSTQL